MEYSFAPMEGVTSRTFRELHARYFPGVDRYCLPFLSPTREHILTDRQRRELDPGTLGCHRLVPQILTAEAGDFLWAAGAIAALGYREVDLNLGCPSGTVVSKGKGAGMLRDLDRLRRFLDAIYAAAPIAVSVKTRLGLEREEEFGPILKLLADYPVSQLTIHPRTRREMYTGTVHLAAFAEAARVWKGPLVYNGNLFTAASAASVKTAFPGLHGLMLGRGMLADPALVTRIRGGERSREALIGFHEELCAAYLETMHPNQAVLPKLKEIWMYLALLFDDAGLWSRLRRTKRWEDFHPLALAALQTLPLRREADLSPVNQSPVEAAGIRQQSSDTGQ